jgi:hypothetical protein
MGDNSPNRSPPAGVQRLISQPMGIKTKPSLRTGRAGVRVMAVTAGIMASSSGRAMVAPMPRRKVRRGRDFLVRIMSFFDE